MLQRILAAAIVAGCMMVGTGSSASAELGSAFSSARHECLADSDVTPEIIGAGGDMLNTNSGPVTSRHFLPVVRLTGWATTVGNSSGGSGNLDGPHGTIDTDPHQHGDLGTDTWYGRSNVVYWASANTFNVGQVPVVSGDCAERANNWVTTAQWFDRPSTPASFAGTRNHPYSIVGFTAPRKAHYEVEVDPGYPGLRVARESFQLFEGTWTEDGSLRFATFNTPGVLDLGTLDVGPHFLTVGGPITDDAAKWWSLVVREVIATAPPSAPPPVNPVVIPPGTTPAPPSTVQNPAPVSGDPIIINIVTAPAQDVAGTTVASIPSSTTAPRPKALKLKLSGTGRYRTVRVTCQRTRCRVVLTVKVGGHRIVRKVWLQRNRSASVTVRPRGRLVTAKATITNLGVFKTFRV